MPGRARARSSPRASAAWARPCATRSTACSSTALDAADLARQLDRLAAEPGLLERLQAGIEAPRPFAEYVDELEAYYAGAAPVARAAGTPPRPAITWQGDHGLHTSLSHINNEVTARLERVQRLDRAGAPLDTPLPHPADVEVRHQWPPDLRPPRSGRLAVIQPWEFGAIPAEWVPAAHARTSTRSGCPAATCATCTCAPAWTTTASTSCPTASTSSASRPRARPTRSTPRTRCASSSSAAPSAARASTSCSPPGSRPSPAATTCSS